MYQQKLVIIVSSFRCHRKCQYSVATASSLKCQWNKFVFITANIGFQWHSRVVRGYDQKVVCGHESKVVRGHGKKVACDNGWKSYEGTRLNYNCVTNSDKTQNHIRFCVSICVNHKVVMFVIRVNHKVILCFVLPLCQTQSQCGLRVSIVPITGSARVPCCDLR